MGEQRGRLEGTEGRLGEQREAIRGNRGGRLGEQKGEREKTEGWTRKNRRAEEEEQRGWKREDGMCYGRFGAR